MKKQGTIITFYSFKGGVGRTMSLVNIAILLEKKYKVLIIDFDLEAPGLANFLSVFHVPSDRNESGMLELLENANSTNHSQEMDYHKYIRKVTETKHESLFLLNSGNVNNNYSFRVQSFDWQMFFDKNQGGLFFENFRDWLKGNFDFILIDSRTGYSDTSGICTFLLPDVLILLFSSNDQSVQGTLEVAEKAQISRQKLAFDRMPLTIFPIPARIDKTEEYLESRKWSSIFVNSFKKYYRSWLPDTISTERVLEEITIPYVGYYSFGEKLPVLEDSLTKKESPAYYYSQISRIIESNFREIEKILSPFSQGKEDYKDPGMDDFLKSLQPKLNLRQIEIIKKVQREGTVSNKWCRETFGIVNDTVNRDLRQLLEMKLIIQEGKGRSTRYVKGEKMVVNS